jgi:hypothetical protein
MPDTPDISRRDAAALAAYADGRLEGRKLERFEERLRSEPALAAELEKQRRALRAMDVAVAATVAPAGLRQRVEALQREAAAPARRKQRRSFLVPGVGLATAAAAVLLAIIVVGGGAGGPTAEDALAFAGRPVEERVTPDRRTPQLLEEEVEGVRFPNYLAKFGWRPVGERADEVDGRTVRTVFYEKDGTRIAYSIFAGEALDVPEGRKVTVEGTEITIFGDDAVTWERDGHTCVLSGADAKTLAELAGWKGKGNVPF